MIRNLSYWCLILMTGLVVQWPPSIFARGRCQGQDVVVSTGVDVLQQNRFERVAGQRVGLITNHTGLNRNGVSTVELLANSTKVNLTTLFSPEHGFKGQLDVSKIGDSQDEQTGLRVFSLYGETRRPTVEMLADVDTLVFDIQDIGARFYTYISTMGEAMIAADRDGKRFVVLDRPNPIGGLAVAGPMLDPGTESFVGFHTLPVRHGMTIGELAKMFCDEKGLSLQLDVVPCEGWTRSMTWDETGLLWVNPSPNMRSLTQAFLYPGVGMLETTNLSVGRGTDTPFEIVGAPWMDSTELAGAMRRSDMPGVAFVPIRFTPQQSRFKGKECGGINILITRRDRFDPIQMGLRLATVIQSLYGEKWNGEDAMRLMGSRDTLDAIVTGASAERVMEVSRSGVREFLQRRSKYLMY